MPNLFQWLRTVRHFPPAALIHRLRLKAARLGYQPVVAPEFLADEWQQLQESPSARPLPLSFAQWQYGHNAAYREQCRQQANQLLQHGQGLLLNEPFDIFQTIDDLRENLPGHTPLWQENYGYLEFLLPVILPCGATNAERAENMSDNRHWLAEQFQQFWQLDAKQRTWSTYGVSRRLLTYCQFIPLLPDFPEPFRILFWQHFYQETLFLHAFQEVDIRGNHLIKNLTALLAATSVLTRLPSAQDQAHALREELVFRLPRVFKEQLLADGIHYERTPMYHLWVLQDLLECLSWLQIEPSDTSCRRALIPIVSTMVQAARHWRHASHQLPLFGDSSLPQTPELALLEAYATSILSSEEQSIVFGDMQNTGRLLHHFSNAGFAVFRQHQPDASLIVDCGDFGPRSLPAHSHCDIGHFELHVNQTPIIVDSGVSDYTPSLLRDYFRGTAAHNTVWVPGEEQAEIWGGFRVAEYPELQQSEVGQDAGGAKVTVRYENYNRRYQHQRSIYSVGGHFWVVQDWLLHLRPQGRDCYSLLHIHPDCNVRMDGTLFTIQDQLMILPFGIRQVEWADYAPWRRHLNLYSPGFNQARPGKLIAAVPKLPDCFGWVLVPFSSGQKPVCESLGDGARIELPGIGIYQLTWDSSGLHVAFLPPNAANP